MQKNKKESLPQIGSLMDRLLKFQWIHGFQLMLIQKNLFLQALIL